VRKKVEMTVQLKVGESAVTMVVMKVSKMVDQ